MSDAESRRNDGYGRDYRDNKGARNSGRPERESRGGFQRRDDRDNRGGFQRDDRREGGFRNNDRREGGFRNNDRRDDRGDRGFQRDDRREGGFRNNDRREGGFRNNDRRDDRGDRGFQRDDRREGGFRNNDRREGGFRNNDRRDDRGDRGFQRDDRREGGFRNNDRRDDRGGFQRRDDRGDRGFQRDDRREGGFRNNDRRDDRGGFRNNERGGFQRRDDRGDRGFQRDDRREGGFRNNDRRDDRREGGFRNNDRRDDRDNRKSDQHASQRHDAPQIPENITYSMLDRDARARLRGLSKENAEVVGLHLIMTGKLLDSDPELAYKHAQEALRRGGRVDIVREAAGLAAYYTERYAEALREFRTVRRLNGSSEHLALMADCERGLGRPEKAIALAQSEEAAGLNIDAQVELGIVVAGARVDLEENEAALAQLDLIEVPAGRRDLQVRVIGARAAILGEVLGRVEEAEELLSHLSPAELASIEEPLGDNDEDDVLVYDLADEYEDSDDEDDESESASESSAEPQDDQDEN